MDLKVSDCSEEVIESLEGESTYWINNQKYRYMKDSDSSTGNSTILEGLEQENADLRIMRDLEAK